MRAVKANWFAHEFLYVQPSNCCSRHRLLNCATCFTRNFNFFKKIEVFAV